MRRLLALALASAACTREAPRVSPPDAAARAEPAPRASAASLVAARPYALTIPRSLDRAKPAPLVLMLHGYGSTGAEHAAAWHLAELAERARFVLAAPDGTPDATGSRFWNATDACCNFEHAPVDDVAYLTAVIDDASAKVAIDPKRVYVLGHSNGGFMAHRLACDVPERIAAIVSLAGATWKDASKCGAASPVAIAQVHGTRDAIVSVDGGVVFRRPLAPYPSLDETMGAWARKLGCAGEPERDAARLDLDTSIAGSETRVDRWRGCRAALERWTIEGGSHVPALGRAWGDAVWAFFDAHPKP